MMRHPGQNRGQGLHMAGMPGVTMFGRHQRFGRAVLNDDIGSRVHMTPVRLGRDGPERDKADHDGDEGDCEYFHGA